MTTPITPTQSVTVAPKREIRVVEDSSALSYLFDTAKFEHSYRIAEAMARASLIPKHLKGPTKEDTAANCFLVVNQALRWNLDPFAVAPETYEVHGKLGYQGKLVAAVINTRAGLAERLSYTFSGTKGKDDFTVTVSGRFEGRDKSDTVTLSVGQAKTANEMWTKDPEQKLIYSGAVRWARRHAPEVILGVTTDDDLEAMRDEARIIAAKPVKTPKFEGLAPLREQLGALTPGTEVTVSSEAVVRTPEGVKEAPPEPQKAARKRPTMVEQPLEPKAPETLSEAKEEAKPALANDPALSLLHLATDAGISLPELITYLRKDKWLKETQTKLSEMSMMKLDTVLNVWKAEPSKMVQKIRAANEGEA